MCEQEQEQREWLEAFRKVIDQPMTPEDYSSKTLLLLHLSTSSCFVRWHKHEVHVLIYTNDCMALCSAVDEANLRRGK